MTPKINRAIKFAIKTHEIYQKQKRKGKDVSYIIHPLTAAILLAKIGANDDIIAAGILHDTIEDSTEQKKVDKEMLAQRFGNLVAEVVSDVTEKDKALAWEKRKEVAISKIKTFPRDSLLVKSADFISNVAELLQDYEKEGDKVFEHFNAPKEKKLASYLVTANALIESFPTNPFMNDLLYLEDRLKQIK